MQIVRVLSHLEPGGLQLSALRLTRALEEQGVRTRLAIAHATPQGRELYRRARADFEVWGCERSLQYVPDRDFAEWLQPRLAEADLVHGHAFGGWWAAATAAPGRLPIVGSEHNALQWPGEVPAADAAAALDRVDRFFAHGPAARQQVLALGLDPARLADGRSPVPIPEAAPRRPAGAEGIIFVGRLHPEKGPDVLLRAAALLDRRVPLRVVGDGPAAGDLRELAGTLGLRAQFTGWVDDPAPLIARAQVCATPSRFDASSQAALLAMGLCVPVVGSDVEGLALLLGQGRGVPVPPEDPAALAAALEDVLSGRRAPDTAAARRFALSFTPRRVARYYAGHYRQLLRQRGRSLGAAATPSPAR